MAKIHHMRMRTGTATLAVFDPQRLRHRLADACDWWSVPWEEVAEINAGNLFSVALGGDGVYGVAVHLFDDGPDMPALSGLIRCDGGEVFIGAGEQIPGDGLEPDLAFGGLSLAAPAGTYRVSVRRRGPFEIAVWLAAAVGEARNAFGTSPQLES